MRKLGRYIKELKQFMSTLVSLQSTFVMEKRINIGMNIDMIAGYILLTFWLHQC